MLGWSPNISPGIQVSQAPGMDPSLQATISEPGPSHHQGSSHASATLIPTAVGLHPEEGHSSALSQEICNIIALTVSKSTDAVLTQRGILAPVHAAELDLWAFHPTRHIDREYMQEPQLPSSSNHSDMSLMREEDMADYNLSKDEGVLPDRPVATGLFCHDLFKTLLNKAKTTANIGALIGTLRDLQIHCSALH